MCGIIGYVGEGEAAPVLIDGLRRLEYRGYDSVGIAVLDDSGELTVHKQEGKLSGLATMLENHWPRGKQGIGHTRWATHGRPSDVNAHPHKDCSGDIVVIHNGIVENHHEIRQRLAAAGHSFVSETDTEVIPHLIEEQIKAGTDLHGALIQTIKQLAGAHAILAMSKSEPGTIVAGRVGNAGGVVIGYGEGENFIASDLPALLPHTRKLLFLGHGDTARVRAGDVSYCHNGLVVHKTPEVVTLDPLSAAKGSYKHFMQKEIAEQPEGLLDTIRGRALFGESRVELDDVRLTADQLGGIRRVMLLGMGTSLHAAMVGRYFFERIAGLPAEFDNASEMRYREPLIGPDTLVVSVTQSGETVDTLAAMEEAKRKGCPQIAITNMPGSQATRVADGTVATRCGLEIGVCSTKTFTASITAMYLLACYLAQERGIADRERMAGYFEPLARLPNLAGEVMKLEPQIEKLAHRFHRCENFLFLGRGLQFPVAMEGALKLKEVSYIHAEGYPAGEMKHGPIALIDERHAGHRPLPARRPAREDAQQHRAGEDARRHRHRRGHGGRPRAGGEGRRGDLRPRDLAAAGAGADLDPAADVRLPRRRPPRLRRRPAATWPRP